MLDVADGRELPETLEGLHYSGGMISWAPDGKGFFYTRFERPPAWAERSARVGNPKIYYHALGTEQAADRLVHERPGERGLYGYGAFAWVAFTWFQPHIIEWMERGGVYAVAGLRGGGEYGAAWHEAGARLNKQNAIDDYVAAAEWLVNNRLTSRRRLVANGGSASGAVAAAILRRPDLFAAGVIDIPVLDMLRFDRFTAAASWTPEFGSPADPREFEALRAYSPYHNVKPGRCYPPTLVMAGERDQTAVPLHAYKFVAAMQAAQGCGHPVLLKMMWGTGHNFGATPEQTVDSWTDLLSFLSRALKMEAESRSGARQP